MTVNDLGPLCFGLVVGWITYRTLRRREGNPAISDIATVIGAVGGGTVVVLFKDATLFAWYSIGLAVGFFLYFIIMLFIEGKQASDWMMG